MKRNYVSCRMLYEAEKSKKKKVKLIVSLIKHETFYCQRDFIVSHKLPLRFFFSAYALMIKKKVLKGVANVIYDFASLAQDVVVE